MSTTSKVKLPEWEIVIASHSHGPDFQTASHAHNCSSLLYVIAGKGICRICDDEYELSADTAIALPPNSQHQLIDQPRKPMTVFVVYFGRSCLQKNSDLLALLESSPPALPVAKDRAMRIRKALRQMLHEQHTKDLKFDAAMNQCLSAILLELLRSQARPLKMHSNPRSLSEQGVAETLRFIAERLYESHSLTMSAKMAGVSQRQFTNLCRKVTGRSFSKYLSHLRMQKAQELLKNTNMPVTAIAFELGYEELSTFYRTFKRHYNHSPLALRQNHPNQP